MLIQYKNVKICQADENIVLSNVNFKVDNGEFVWQEFAFEVHIQRT